MIYFCGSQTWLKKYRCQYRWVWERWAEGINGDMRQRWGPWPELGIRTPKPDCPQSLWTQPPALFESSHIVSSSWDAFSLHLENSAHYSRPSSDVASPRSLTQSMSLFPNCCDLSCDYFGRGYKKTIGLEFTKELEELSQLQIMNNKGSIWRAGWKLQDKGKFMMSSSLFHLLCTLLKHIAVCVCLLMWNYRSYCLVSTNLILTQWANSWKSSCK